MTIVIVSILLLGCLLIATENITKVNRAAVAIFAGTVGWVLYICFGMDFVSSTAAHAASASSSASSGLLFFSRYGFRNQSACL